MEGLTRRMRVHTDHQICQIPSHTRFEYAAMLRQGTPRASRHGLDARLRVITPRLSTERSGWHHRLGEPSTSSLRAGLCTGAPCQNVFPQDRKGKQREISCSCLPRGDRGLSQDDIPYAPLQGRIASSIRPFQRRSATHLSPYLAQLRAFHASEPRRAIPLIPAGLGILKVSGPHSQLILT